MGDDATPQLRPGRAITGMSAVLLPYTVDGEIDWDNVAAHIARTHGAGLTPAVNMDTGYVQLLTPEEREQVLDLAATLTDGDFVAGAYVADDLGAPFDLDAYLAASDAIARRGGTPVIFPSYGLNALVDDAWVDAHAALGARLERFIGFELGPMFVPYGRIVGLDAYRGLMAIGACIGAKHSSLSRRSEWDRLALRDAHRPDFHVFTGNDLAIDMVMYGSDYLLGLSTFAPAEFAAARSDVAGRRPGIPRAERRVAVPRRLLVPGAGPGLPPQRVDVVRAPRLGRDRRNPARSAPPPGRGPGRPLDARRTTRRARGRAPVTGDRYPQVKSLRSVGALRTRLDALGVDIPVADDVDAGGPLATPVAFTDASAGTFTAPNRFAVLPMEGWDGSASGAPTDLVRRRWERFGHSGAGLVWGEATAVRHDGRANARQLVIDETTVAGISELRARLDPAQVVGLQLTHSGRWSRPDGTPAPRTAYAHPLLDARVDASASARLTDDELDALADDYVRAAVLAAGAGFDFVDVKHCHGYLLHELLSARARDGRYGGDLAGRTRFLRTVVTGIRARAPRLAVAVRLSAFDLVPFVPGDDGTGVPEADGTYPYAFGGDGTGRGVDLAETHTFCAALTDLGIGLVSITAGSPYYNPHVQRPAYFPPSDGYRPPEDPLVGVARQLAAAAAVAHAHPALTVVGGAYSYLQDWLPNVAQAVIERGEAGMIGLGRMMLSYPTLAADVLSGRALDPRSVCRTFSDCTTAPRAGLVSGCYPIDPLYKDHPDRAELTPREARRTRLTPHQPRDRSRSRSSTCAGLSFTRASSSVNHPARSTSGKVCIRSERGGHSVSNVLLTIASTSTSPATAHAATTLPPF